MRNLYKDPSLYRNQGYDPEYCDARVAHETHQGLPCERCGARETWPLIEQVCPVLPPDERKAYRRKMRALRQKP